MDKKEVYTHQSYGAAIFSRVSGGANLYGSSIKNHNNFISLKLSRSERIHELSRDRYHPCETLIEVYFSSAQFADLLTTMNFGGGVPCTINWFNGELVDPPPDIETEAEKVRTNFKKNMRDFGTKMKEDSQKLDDLLDGKTVNKKQREEIRRLFRMLIQEVEANIPFVLDQFQEASDKVVSHAKAEVEAMMTSAISAAGVKAIQDNPKNLLSE